MTIDRLAIRLCGTVILIAALLVYDNGSQALWQTLGIPIIMAFAALALVQNVAAVTFGALVLAVIHSELNASHWVPSLAYPFVAVIAALILLAILVNRFRQRIIDTREARWASRRNS